MIKQQISVLILLLFLLHQSNCFKSGSQESLQLQFSEKLQQLSQSSYGRLLLELIQLHRDVGGPVEELMLAIDQFLQENEVKKQREIEQYERLRGEFLDLVQAFQVQIAHAKLDIATAVNKLEVVLKPRMEHLKESLVYIQDNIDENRESYEEESKAREAKHNHYLKNKKEFDNAIMVLEESIELIFNLWNQNAPSFVQVNKARRSIAQLKRTILGQDNTFAPMITALMSIAQDQSQSAEVFFEQVTNLLNQCKQLVVEQMAQQTESENRESEAWNEREMFLNSDYNNFVKRQKEEQDEIKSNENKIEAEKQLKEDREADYQKLLIELKRENEDFQKQTDIHNRLMSRLEKDKNLTISAKAVILQHADSLNKFADQERKAVDWKNKEKLWD